SDGIEALLSWAKDHPAAVIRNKAARIRSDLSELTARRKADDAQREAEQRVAKLKAELEQTQETLRAVEAGGRPTAPAPTGTKRSKEQLGAIRTWARANGHQVADKGNPAKAVLDAYDAAHRTTNLAAAS
ncbi:histone-like nucleoid-structuring protein Lsr2, partial [Streptomyces sp. NPDC088178]|uniref:Lsr2 family DNA-binding protein n=1 Tax=Streptomyces sp. NPDC088178 TaxID=3365836 RepID=UPI003828FD1C